MELSSQQKRLHDETSARMSALEFEEATVELLIQPEPIRLEGHVVEQDGIYARIKDNLELNPISNFTMKIVGQVRGDKWTTYDIDIHAQDGTVVRQLFSSHELCKLSQFKDRLSLLGLPLSFQGKQADLEDVRLMMAGKQFEQKQGVDHIGIMWADDEAVFLSHDRCIKANGTEYKGFVVSKYAVDVCTDLLEFDPISTEELEEIVDPLFGFNSLPITATVMGYIGSCFLRPLLKKIGIKHGSLLLIGESGSGKSTTLDEVIRPLLGCGTSFSAAHITEASLWNGISSSNTIPFIVEEYKPDKLSKQTINMICNTLRTNYDQTLMRKCSGSNSIVEKQLRAPLILVGESQPSETAIRERCLQVLFSKDILEERPEYKDCITVLRRRPLLLHKLGRSMLQMALTIDLDTLKSWHAGLMSDAAEFEGCWPERIRNSYANGMLGIELLEAVCESHGQYLPDLIGINPKQFGDALKIAIQEYLLQGKNHNRSIVEEGLAVMFGDMSLVAGKDYKYLNNGTELAIDLNGVYDSFTRLVRGRGCAGQIELLPKSQFEQQLKLKRFYKESRTVSMNGRQKKRCIILDAALLRGLIGDYLPIYSGSSKTVA